MIFTRSFSILFLFLLAADARLGAHHRHEAVHLQKKQASVAASLSVAATASLSAGVIALVTPSPGASPIAVTAQSQVLTSYAPQYTLCALPSTLPVPMATSQGHRYRNHSISNPSSTDSCSVYYSSTETTVCATTLTGLASKIPITDCAQEVTFSTEFGYKLFTPTPTPTAASNATGILNNTLATITPGPSIQTLTTYFIAPWAELTAGTAPADITRKVCESFANGTYECIEAFEIWRTVLVTSTATSTFSLNFTATVSGPSQMIVFETFIANITEIQTTVSFQTSLETEYLTEIESTHVTSALMTTAPTVYQTRTVQEVSSSARPRATTTVHLTRTVYAGTTTLTTKSGSTAGPLASAEASASVAVVGN